jgi:hypothetical protein
MIEKDRFVRASDTLAARAESAQALTVGLRRIKQTRERNEKRRKIRAWQKLRKSLHTDL